MQIVNLKSVHPEIRAYIYQQLSDLESHLPEGSVIALEINEGKQKKHKIITATIKVETPFGDIQSNSETSDIYQSLADAKEDMIKQIDEATRAMNEGTQTEYDFAVDAVIKKQILH